MIIDIDVSKIHPHPNNPRKELGDLSELADSIKVNGVMQNLTVVPWIGEVTGEPIEDRYKIVIGHRRHAAAKVAGLTKLPCVLSEMDENTQIATMLLENMQRNDLRLDEEVHGFQMMIDLGETVSSISGKTGFSKDKVKGRVKLSELDQDKFRQSVERGGSIKDYAALDKIKNISLRNEVLERIGTSNFDWTLKNAIATEKREKNKAKLVAELGTFATFVKKNDGLRTVQWIYLDKPDFKKPDDAGKKKYFYCFSPPHYIYLLEETAQEAVGSAEDAEKRKAQQEAQRKMQETKERRDRLGEIIERAYQLRFEFIRDYAVKKKHAREIMEFATRALIQSDWFDYETFEEMTGVEFNEDEGLSFNAVSEDFAAAPERVMMLAAYCNGADSSEWTYYDHNCKYMGNHELDAIYDFLEKLGYQMSDEERTLRDGTHAYYVRDEEGNDGEK